jgi:phage antirepressor YoqD-like protein
MNNIVSITDGRAVTTSLAIAEGVGNPHATIIRLIRDNAVDLEEFGLLGFQIRPRSQGQHGGGDAEYAILNEQQATLLMTYMRNNDVVRAFKKRLVKAFYEFAAGTTPKSFAEALRLAADQAERIEAQQQKIAEDAPKVAFHDQVAATEGALRVRDVAKVLGTGEHRLYAFLRRSGWVDRWNKPYQSKIEAGYLDVKLGQFTHPLNGLQESVTTLVTGKGLARLQQIYVKATG